MKFKEFTLDLFQEEAIGSIEKNNSVIVSAPTGSGKTLIADYIIDKSIREQKRVIYTAPIKALSNQKYKDFLEEYGHDSVGLVTGDIVHNPGAQILIMTTEVYRNMAIINDPVLDSLSYVVMDEIHFIGDEERGHVWEESIIFSPEKIRFLFLSATIPNAAEFADWITNIKGHPVDVVRSDYRPVPLDIRFFDAELGISTLKEIAEKKDLDNVPDYRSLHSRRSRSGDFKRAKVPAPDYRELVRELKAEDKLPCIYFVFSRLKTQQYAHLLSKQQDFLVGEERSQATAIVQEMLRGKSQEVLSLKSTLQQRECLARGIAFHHAGLLPDIKHVVERLFTEGLIKVLFATETFAVGINMPARTVCFDSLRKFTGTGFRYLNSKEFFQISGRAGRRGKDTSGLSVSVIHRPSAELGKIRQVTSGDNLPLQSQFKISYNTVLNMVDQYSEKEIDLLLRMNFYTFQHVGTDNSMIAAIKARFDNAKKTLAKMGYIDDEGLTEMGKFTTKIFSDEIEMSQIFFSGTIAEPDEMMTLLLVASLAYEDTKDFKFEKIYPSKQISDLITRLRAHPYLKNGKWLKSIHIMSAIAAPLYSQKTFTQILKNTSMVEGDLLRLLMQMLDRLEQADKAFSALLESQEPSSRQAPEWAQPAEDVEGRHRKQKAVIGNCKYLIRKALEGIGIF